MSQVRLFVSALLTAGMLTVAAMAVNADHESAYRSIERADLASLKEEIAKDPAVVNSRNSNGMPLLNRAAMTDCVECVKLLLATGADVEAVDRNFVRTALHCAAGWSTVEMVRLLVSSGAAINARAKDGNTPLAFARENFYKDKYDERAKITTFLIKSGAK